MTAMRHKMAACLDRPSTTPFLRLPAIDSAWRRSVSFVLVTTNILATFIAPPAVAHDSPGDVIHALSHRIETNGPTARLLVARAFEYQYLNQWDASIADFEAALALQPKYGAAIKGLASTLLRQGQLERATAAARQGIDLTTDLNLQASLHAVLAQVHARRKHWEDALISWRQSLRSEKPEIDWYLGEAEALERLNRPQERADALARARERNPSVVLHRTWLHALVDAGRLDEALVEIEAGMAKAHWKSAWLLLRARIHAQRGLRPEQQADARAALEEIHLRWNWKRPDRNSYLIADAALALGLLDRDEEAREHLEKARELGVTENYLREIETSVQAANHSKP